MELTTLPIKKEDHARFLSLELAYSKKNNKKLSHVDFFSIVLDKIEEVLE